ncbi:MAG: hypothetical protein INR71_01300 [Terriglobus roseus]|nr:hypothetical protein [Terriglobus roseus]
MLTSVQVRSHGPITAQPSRPTVAKIKMKTTAWSLAESRQKHWAKTSSSSAPLQKGRL